MSGYLISRVLVAPGAALKPHRPFRKASRLRRSVTRVLLPLGLALGAASVLSDLAVWAVTSW